MAAHFSTKDQGKQMPGLVASTVFIQEKAILKGVIYAWTSENYPLIWPIQPLGNGVLARIDHLFDTQHTGGGI